MWAGFSLVFYWKVDTFRYTPFAIYLTMFGVGLGQFGEFRGRLGKKFYDI